MDIRTSPIKVDESMSPTPYGDMSIRARRLQCELWDAERKGLVNGELHPFQSKLEKQLLHMHIYLAKKMSQANFEGLPCVKVGEKHKE